MKGEWGRHRFYQKVVTSIAPGGGRKPKGLKKVRLSGETILTLNARSHVLRPNSRVAPNGGSSEGELGRGMGNASIDLLIICPRPPKKRGDCMLGEKGEKRREAAGAISHLLGRVPPEKLSRSNNNTGRRAGVGGALKERATNSARAIKKNQQKSSEYARRKTTAE